MADELSKLEEFTLILLNESAFGDHGALRSWKGYDWGLMNRLHQRGLISDPVRKAKSVFLTDEGRTKAEALALEYLGQAAGRTRDADRSCQCGCGEPSSGGGFKPGHDQKLRAQLEARVGGLLALRSLVEAAAAYADGHAIAEELTSEVRGIFGDRE